MCGCDCNPTLFFLAALFAIAVALDLDFLTAIGTYNRAVVAYRVILHKDLIAALGARHKNALIVAVIKIVVLVLAVNLVLNIGKILVNLI